MLNHTVPVKFLDPRLHEWGVSYSSSQSAGIDLRACVEKRTFLHPGETLLIGSGLAVDMSWMRGNNCAAFIFPRSGMGHNKGLVLGNGTGVIDQDYQGEIKISAFNRNPVYAPFRGSMRQTHAVIEINPGDRIAQLVFMPVMRMGFDVRDQFTGETRRGAGGFGSTGVAS